MDKMDKHGMALSDDMLDSVSGGTADETEQLMELLGVDKYSLSEALKAYGVTGTAFFSANNYGNSYALKDGTTISHDALVKLIKDRKNNG